MKTTTLKAQVKSVCKRLASGLIKSIQAIAAAIVADTATHLIHAKGAPGNG
jgi:hypothetical protein